MAANTGPKCPGSTSRVPHDMEELAFRDELARSSGDKNITLPMRVVYCSACGYVFSVAPRAKP